MNGIFDLVMKEFHEKEAIKEAAKKKVEEEDTSDTLGDDTPSA
jgi:hypothetical protein